MCALHSDNIRLCHEVDEAFYNIKNPIVCVMYSYFVPHKFFEACVWINEEKHEYQYGTDRLNEKSQMNEALRLRNKLLLLLQEARDQGVVINQNANRLHHENIKLCLRAEDIFEDIIDPIMQVIFCYYGQSKSFEAWTHENKKRESYQYTVDKLDDADELAGAQAFNKKLKEMFGLAERVKAQNKLRSAV